MDIFLSSSNEILARVVYVEGCLVVHFAIKPNSFAVRVYSNESNCTSLPPPIINPLAWS